MKVYARYLNVVHNIARRHDRVLPPKTGSLQISNFSYVSYTRINTLMTRSFILYKLFLYFIISSIMFIAAFVLGTFCHLFNKRILDWSARISRISQESQLSQSNSATLHIKMLSRIKSQLMMWRQKLHHFTFVTTMSKRVLFL